MTAMITKRHVSFNDEPPKLYILDRIVDDEPTKSELFYQKEDFRRFSRMYREKKVSKMMSPSKKNNTMNIFWNTIVDHRTRTNNNDRNSRYYGNSNNVYFTSSSSVVVNDAASTIVDKGDAVYAWV